MGVMAPRRIVILLAALAGSWALPVSAQASSPVSSHAMVYTCCTPYELKDRIFAESKAAGASFIRVDVEMSAIFERFSGRALLPDWRGLEDVLELSRKHELPVLGIILNTPAFVSTCPERWPDSYRCPARDPAEYGRLAGEIAAHARGTIHHWEILNEPDGRWAFEGTPEEYARMLSASYDAIKARAPEASVVMGGVQTPWEQGWVRRVFATAGADAARKFDIANLHLRGRAADLPRHLADWRGLLAGHGFAGPVWVTEHGYAADPAYQIDPRYTGGDAAQAAYLEQSLLGLAETGAEQVFVTMRDNLGGEWASEGLVHIDEMPGYPSTRRPAFYAVRRFAERWPEVRPLLAEQRRHERLARSAAELAEAADRRADDARRRGGQARRAAGRHERALRRLRSIARTCGRRRGRSSKGSRCSSLGVRRTNASIVLHEVRLRGRRLEYRRAERDLRGDRARAVAQHAAAEAHAAEAAGYARRVSG